MGIAVDRKKNVEKKLMRKWNNLCISVVVTTNILASRIVQYLSISENVFFGFQKSGFRVLQSMWDFCLKEIVFITCRYIFSWPPFRYSKVPFNEILQQFTFFGF